MTRVHLTLKSANRKTGPIPVSTSSAETCPETCGLRGNGCYAESGPLGLHWRKVTEGARGMEWGDFCAAIAALPEGQLWRHNQAGDLPVDAEGDLDPLKVAYLIRANRGRRGFTYTHHDMTKRVNRVVVVGCNANGFTVNLSADTLAQADELAEHRVGPVVVVLNASVHGNQTLETPKGRKVVVCPATYRDDVSCASCALCAVAQRDCIVGFPAHGSNKAKASKVTRG